MGEAGLAQGLAQRFLAQDNAHPGQVRARLGQRPARERDALGVGAGARDRDDALALLRRAAVRPAARP